MTTTAVITTGRTGLPGLLGLGGGLDLSSAGSPQSVGEPIVQSTMARRQEASVHSGAPLSHCHDDLIVVCASAAAAAAAEGGVPVGQQQQQLRTAATTESKCGHRHTQLRLAVAHRSIDGRSVGPGFNPRRSSLSAYPFRRLINGRTIH
eukprot:GHVU01136098.1.p1 GENE.GHVU01136098.1~~GHVU01136098.1.p1  ORF type:complete len:149 (-),score=20.48 GHVU01136098.1:420-866(-)